MESCQLTSSFLRHWSKFSLSTSPKIERILSVKTTFTCGACRGADDASAASACGRLCVLKRETRVHKEGWQTFLSRSQTLLGIDTRPGRNAKSPCVLSGRPPQCETDAGAHNNIFNASDRNVLSPSRFQPTLSA